MDFAHTGPCIPGRVQVPASTCVIGDQGDAVGVLVLVQLVRLPGARSRRLLCLGLLLYLLNNSG
jgi:hypothetical protein